MTRVTQEELEITLRALGDRTRNDDLLTLQEGHFKVQVLGTMLDLGFEIQEGCPRRGLANFARRCGRRTLWERRTRLVTCEGGSSDVVTLLDGTARQFELKTRSDHGSKSGAATRELAADFDRVAQRDGFVFLGAFDRGVYRSFSGAKTERRGRKAIHASLTAMFLPIERLAPGVITWIDVEHNGHPMRFGLLRQDLDEGEGRVLVIGSRR